LSHRHDPGRVSYTPTPRNGDESMSMPSPPMGLTQMGYFSHSFFDQPPRCSSDMDDSDTQVDDDDDDNDMQDLESNDSFGQVVGKSEVQTIVCMLTSLVYMYIFIYSLYVINIHFHLISVLIIC
jgi:hypothetical protein